MKFPPLALGDKGKLIALVIVVVLIFAIMALIMWWRSRSYDDSIDIEGNVRTNGIISSSISLDAGYVVSSNFSREHGADVDVDFANDKISFVLNGTEVTIDNKTVPIVLSSSKFVMRDYFGKTIIISNNLSFVDDVRDVYVTFQHGSATYRRLVPIITRLNNYSFVIEVPTFGYVEVV